MVKIIDIDLERRRISLSLKQANENVAVTDDQFDPSLYGMTASYDQQGNYIYPEGFDPETGEWLPGHEDAQRQWEAQYAEAHARWEAHKEQIEGAKKADLEAGDVSNYSTDTDDPAVAAAVASSTTSSSPAASSGGGEGALASDEALQALREKLTGG
jgi:small subunit ribosomal protein S1